MLQSFKVRLNVSANNVYIVLFGAAIGAYSCLLLLLQDKDT